MCFVQLSRPAVSTGSRGGILAHCMNHWRQKSDALYRHDAMGFHGTSCFPGCDYRTSNDRSHGSWQGGSLMSWDLRLEARAQKSQQSQKSGLQDLSQLVLLGVGEPFQLWSFDLWSEGGGVYEWVGDRHCSIMFNLSKHGIRGYMWQKTPKPQGQIGSWHEQEAIPETSMQMDLFATTDCRILHTHIYVYIIHSIYEIMCAYTYIYI